MWIAWILNLFGGSTPSGTFTQVVEITVNFRGNVPATASHTTPATTARFVGNTAATAIIPHSTGGA